MHVIFQTVAKYSAVWLIQCTKSNTVWVLHATAVGLPLLATSLKLCTCIMLPFDLLTVISTYVKF